MVACDGWCHVVLFIRGHVAGVDCGLVVVRRGLARAVPVSIAEHNPLRVERIVVLNTTSGGFPSSLITGH